MNSERDGRSAGTSMPVREAFDHFGATLLARYDSDAEAGWARLCRAFGEDPGPTPPARVHDVAVSRTETGIRSPRGPVDAVGVLALAHDTGRGDDRERTRAVVSRARELLGGNGVHRFDAEDSASVLHEVATVSEMLIADRDERTALRLLWDAAPHLEALGPHDPRGFGVRRAWATAQSERGLRAVAERLLLRLARDELRVMNSVDPETRMRLLWIRGLHGEPDTATAGLARLRDGLDPERAGLSELVTHLDCRRNWLLGQQGRVGDAVTGYEGVIAARTALLGPDDAETYDARFSLAKMFVVHAEGARAISELEGVGRDRRAMLGRDHPDTVETAKYLAIARAQTRPHDERFLDSTIDYLRTILRDQTDKHGSGHPSVLDTAAWIVHLRTAPRAPMIDLARTPERDNRVAPATVR
ncbi:hypothetical protein ACWEKT_06405 [Nocardia takedensis]